MLLWLLLLALLLGALFLALTGDVGTIAGLDPSTFAALVASGTLLVALGYSLLGSYRGRIGQAVKDLTVWVAVALALVAAYSYRQEFTAAGRMLDYTLSLEATADHVIRFDHMAKVFSGTLPKDRYCEVRYEDVVADLEGQVRRLLEFCGLGFEEACVRFEQNASPVATASAAQVRQKIYASSVARWKKYRPGIDGALRKLADAGVMDAAELG